MSKVLEFTKMHETDAWKHSVDFLEGQIFYTEDNSKYYPLSFTIDEFKRFSGLKSESFNFFIFYKENMSDL